MLKEGGCEGLKQSSFKEVEAIVFSKNVVGARLNLDPRKGLHCWIFTSGLARSPCGFKFYKTSVALTELVFILVSFASLTWETTSRFAQSVVPRYKLIPWYVGTVLIKYPLQPWDRNPPPAKGAYDK